MKLYLIRHGESEPGAPENQTRNLTAVGQNHAQKAADWLAQVVDAPIRLWVSPYQRTQQTALPIAEALSVNIESHNCITPEMTPQKVVDELIDQQHSIILVTHLPLVGRLASLLINGVAMDQPWSPTEIWELEGDVFAPGCLENTNIWYPTLDE